MTEPNTAIPTYQPNDFIVCFEKDGQDTTWMQVRALDVTQDEDGNDEMVPAADPLNAASYGVNIFNYGTGRWEYTNEMINVGNAISNAMHGNMNPAASTAAGRTVKIVNVPDYLKGWV